MIEKRELTKVLHSIYAKGGRVVAIDCFNENGDFIDAVSFDEDEPLSVVMEEAKTLPGRFFHITHNLIGGEDG